jgi:hypothetical protein
VPSALTWIACNKLIPPLWFASRGSGLLTLGVLGLAYLGGTWLTLRLLGFWIPEDLALLRGLTGRVAVRRLVEPTPAST